MDGKGRVVTADIRVRRVREDAHSDTGDIVGVQLNAARGALEGAVGAAEELGRLAEGRCLRLERDGEICTILQTYDGTRKLSLNELAFLSKTKGGSGVAAGWMQSAAAFARSGAVFATAETKTVVMPMMTAAKSLLRAGARSRQCRRSREA